MRSLYNTKAISADMASRAWRQRRRSTCPQLHSSLSCPAWPMTCRPSPSLPRLYISCLCHPSMFSPGQGNATQKVQSVIETKGHWGPAGARDPELCPARDDLSQVMSTTSWTPVEMHRGREKGGERPSLAGTAFLDWWHFFCVVSDRSRLYSLSWEGQGV